MRFLFLGTGASGGVPLIGCKCAVCTSSSPLNKRQRSSALISVGEKRYLIDVGPDFRQQALAFRIDHLNGVLLTHAHADHVAGIDDLRAYYYLGEQRLPCLLSQETFNEIKRRFHYMIQPSGASLPAQLDFRILQGDAGRVQFEGLDVHYVSYFQSDMKVTGFRMGKLAYISDIRTFSDTIFDSLQDIEILVLSALRYKSTAMHLSLSEAIALAKRTSAMRTYFTHIAHDLDHETEQALLPEGFYLSYDGLEIDI